jgi:hypothetical protein
MLAEAIKVESTSVPVLATTPRASSWEVAASNSARSRDRAMSSRRTRTKAVRSGVGS